MDPVDEKEGEELDEEPRMGELRPTFLPPFRLPSFPTTPYKLKYQSLCCSS